jgi:hypothetical protein
MSKPFNIEEFNMLTVVSDLLLKGEVETRIAKYMHERRWSHRRARTFLDKCLLSPEWDKRIWTAYQTFPTLPFGHDKAQFLGESLKATAFHAPRTTPPMPPEEEY